MFASRQNDPLPANRWTGALVLLTGILLPATGHATEVERFDEMVETGGWLCQEAPAQECVDHGWDYADRNGDDRLDKGELQTLREELNGWAEWKNERLSGKDRTRLSVARAIANSLKLDDLIDSYDEDGSGAITRAELLADIELDERPLPEILADKEATDWDAIGKRLGPFGSLVGSLGAP